MTVEPGFGGQSFMADVADAKLAAARRWLDPGGRVRGPGRRRRQAETAEAIGRGGTDVIVAGSALYRAADMAAEVERIRVDRRGGPGRDARRLGATRARAAPAGDAAAVRVDGAEIAAIDRGLLVLLGVGHGDDDATADALARRICELRIFEDDDGRTNRSLLDVGGACLAGQPVHALRGHAPRAAARLHGRGAARPREGPRGCASPTAIRGAGRRASARASSARRWRWSSSTTARSRSGSTPTTAAG